MCWIYECHPYTKIQKQYVFAAEKWKFYKNNEYNLLNYYIMNWPANSAEFLLKLYGTLTNYKLLTVIGKLRNGGKVYKTCTIVKIL